MRVFRAIIDNEAGTVWAPAIEFECPFCGVKISFYTQLRGNQCKYCFRGMPFPTSMVKSIKQRIIYHVQIDPEGEPGQQVYVHNLRGVQ
jgi:hypothetical protein